MLAELEKQFVEVKEMLRNAVGAYRILDLHVFSEFLYIMLYFIFFVF